MPESGEKTKLSVKKTVQQRKMAVTRAVKAVVVAFFSLSFDIFVLFLFLRLTTLA